MIFSILLHGIFYCPLQHWHKLVQIHIHRSYLAAKASPDIHFTARCEIFMELRCTITLPWYFTSFLHGIFNCPLQHWHKLVQKHVYCLYIAAQASTDIHFTSRGEVFMELWWINNLCISDKIPIMKIQT